MGEWSNCQCWVLMLDWVNAAQEVWRSWEYGKAGRNGKTLVYQFPSDTNSPYNLLQEVPSAHDYWLPILPFYWHDFPLAVYQSSCFIPALSVLLSCPGYEKDKPKAVNFKLYYLLRALSNPVSWGSGWAIASKRDKRLSEESTYPCLSCLYKTRMCSWWKASCVCSHQLSSEYSAPLLTLYTGL